MSVLPVDGTEEKMEFEVELPLSEKMLDDWYAEISQLELCIPDDEGVIDGLDVSIELDI